MSMKTAYKVYLFCCVLFLTGLFLLVPVYAVEDMWTAASRIIKDIYTHIASVSTVLAGRMNAPVQRGGGGFYARHRRDRCEDVQHPAEIGSGMGLAEAHLAGVGHHQRHRRIYRLCCSAVSGTCHTGAVKYHIPRMGGVTDYA